MSKKPTGVPDLAAMPATRRLVEEPIRVVFPPRSDMKDSGMSACSTGNFRWVASVASTGMKMTTTGVLLSTADNVPAAMSAMPIAIAPEPPSPAIMRAGWSIASVANSPCPTMRSASTVASAGLAKPEIRSVDVIGVPSAECAGKSAKRAMKAARLASATVSIGQRSQT